MAPVKPFNITSLLIPHRVRLGGGAVCLVLLAVTSACYAYLTGPVLQLVLTGGAMGASYVPFPTAWIQAAPRSTVLGAVALVIAALALVKGGAHLGQALLLEGTAETIGHRLRVRAYGQLMRLPLAWHRRRGLGDLLTRLLDDVRRVQEAAVSAPVTLVREGLAAVALLAVAVWMSPRLTLAAAAALPLVGLVIALISRATKRASRHHQRQLAALSDRAARSLGAIREVKSSNAEAREVEAVADHGGRALSWALRRIVVRSSSPLVNELMAAVALGVTLVYAGGQIAAGTLAPERFVSFFAALLLLYRPVKAIGQAVSLMATGAASVERLGQLLDSEPESSPSMALSPLRGRFALNDVCFSYGKEGDPALTGVNLELAVGETVALAGPSGAGKSTLASLVCGLERPESGTVWWDGEDISALAPSELRTQVALVPQQPLVIEGATMAENLRYAAPDATEEHLYQALQTVGLGDLLSRLDEGLDTRLGPPSGEGLSVGETQRLAVARALLRGARLVVLDEPSSALDAESEGRLVGLLGELRECAVLVIAHSPRVLEAVDRVVWVEAGRVVRETQSALRLAGS